MLGCGWIGYGGQADGTIAQILFRYFYLQFQTDQAGAGEFVEVFQAFAVKFG